MAGNLENRALYPPVDFNVGIEGGFLLKVSSSLDLATNIFSHHERYNTTDTYEVITFPRHGHMNPWPWPTIKPPPVLRSPPSPLLILLFLCKVTDHLYSSLLAIIQQQG